MNTWTKAGCPLCVAAWLLAGGRENATHPLRRELLASPRQRSRFEPGESWPLSLAWLVTLGPTRTIFTGTELSFSFARSRAPPDNTSQATRLCFIHVVRRWGILTVLYSSKTAMPFVCRLQRNHFVAREPNMTNRINGKNKCVKSVALEHRTQTHFSIKGDSMFCRQNRSFMFFFSVVRPLSALRQLN